jgi:hypothetical protein
MCWDVREGTRAPGPTQGDFSQRWEPKPFVANLVAAGLRVGPILASVGAGLLAARLFPRPHDMFWVAWVVGLLAASQLTLRLADRAALRLMPLSAMLRSSLVFPDQAPSRFAAALRAGNVAKMRKEAARATEQGLPADVSEAASTALALVSSLNRHDRGTRGHSERVRAFSEMLAEEIGLDSDARDRLRWGALLHDMGKLCVPPEILNKNGRPTEEEWAILQTHPAEGGRILAPLAGWLGDALHAADQHHERWDGKGYPSGLRGDEIVLSARIVAVADAYAVMTGARAYKKPLPDADARRELTKNAGTQFDPAVVRAMLRVSLGRTTRAAGLLAPLANVPFLGPLINGAPMVPAIISSGAAAVALTASFAAPFGTLEWEQPVDVRPPDRLGLVVDAAVSTSTVLPKSRSTGTRTPPASPLEWTEPEPMVSANAVTRSTGVVTTASPASPTASASPSTAPPAPLVPTTAAAIASGVTLTSPLPTIAFNSSPTPTAATTTKTPPSAATSTTTTVDPKSEKSSPNPVTTTSVSSTTAPEPSETAPTTGVAQEPRGSRLPPLAPTTTLLPTTTEPPTTQTTTTIDPESTKPPVVTTMSPPDTKG